jgi:hypothetical protein
MLSFQHANFESAAPQIRYLGLVENLKALMIDPATSLSAAIYTELSDVEAEINGLTTYDRQVGQTPLSKPPFTNLSNV